MDKLAMINALEGNLIALRDYTYAQIRNGRFFNSIAGRTVTLTQCEIDTIERYYRASVAAIFEFASPANHTQECALAWFSELSPEARTIQVGYLFADRMERNERHADKVANG
jgi:hypothetical protein